MSRRSRREFLQGAIRYALGGTITAERVKIYPDHTIWRFGPPGQDLQRFTGELADWVEYGAWNEEEQGTIIGSWRWKWLHSIHQPVIFDDADLVTDIFESVEDKFKRMAKWQNLRLALL